MSYDPGQIITSQLLINHQKPLSYSNTATLSLPDSNLFGQGYSLLQLLSSLVLILCFTLRTVAKRKTSGNRKRHSEDILFNLTCGKQSQKRPNMQIHKHSANRVPPFCVGDVIWGPQLHPRSRGTDFPHTL